MSQSPAVHPGLGSCDVVAFVPIVDASRAKRFYADILQLHFVSDEQPYALVFNANGIMLRLAITQERPPFPGTVLGWRVPDISKTVRALAQAGVRFERYESMKQDDQGVWSTPTGARVAWFKDPDGNLLSVSEYPEVTK